MNQQVVVPIKYKGDGYQVNIIVKWLAIVEFKLAKAIKSIGEAKRPTQRSLFQK